MKTEDMEYDDHHQGSLILINSELYFYIHTVKSIVKNKQLL